MKTKLFQLTGFSVLLIAILQIVFFKENSESDSSPVLARKPQGQSASPATARRGFGNRSSTVGTETPTNSSIASSEGFTQPQPLMGSDDAPISRNIPLQQSDSILPAPERVMPPAVRLSEDCRLPAASMALAATCADNQLALSSPQIQFANADLITGFYSELAENISRSVDWEHDLEVDPQTGESTVNIKTSPSTDRVRVNSDERFRALFGNDAFNLRLLESAKEQMLPSAGN